MSTFEKIVADFYRTGWEMFPTWGSRAGLAEFDDQLEEPTADLIQTRRALMKETAEAIQKLEPVRLRSAETLDRQVFNTHLTVQELRWGTIQSWRRDPSSLLTDAVESTFELLTRRDCASFDAAHAICRRIERLPAYLRAGRSRIDQPVTLWVQIAAQTVPGAIEFLGELVPPLSERHPRLRAQLESAVQNAIESIQAYGRWLLELTERPMNNDVAVGDVALGQLIRDWHGLHLSPTQVAEQGWAAVQYYNDELEQHARRIDPRSSWRELLDRARHQFASAPQDLLAEYRTISAKLRMRIEGDGLLDFPPGEECRIVATPAFLRPLIPTAAYSNPGPLDPAQLGIFFVTEPDRSLGADEVRAGVGQHYGMEGTCVHEAYPGHHVQLCWANRAASLSRQMANHIISMEGWTLYCEQLMVEQDWFGDPLLTLNYLSEQLWRAYRMIIDVGIHTRTMTVAAAVKMLMDGVGFTRERAESELNWYSQSPGVPMSYLLGKRETLALRDAFLKTPGATLKRFHRWLLSFGSVPQRWLYEYLPN